MANGPPFHEPWLRPRSRCRSRPRSAEVGIRVDLACHHQLVEIIRAKVSGFIHVP
jgi:hypothetical protein